MKDEHSGRESGQCNGPKVERKGGCKEASETGWRKQEKDWIRTEINPVVKTAEHRVDLGLHSG